ncbi:MAG TPA: cation diffusion facilitator family transporter [Casimicrobiaceae bacterium]|jgi:cation diffusion facilitator family transporter|nr:cation diffusion facilitator family transporter [Casimicrobiaceae bacterium]
MPNPQPPLTYVGVSIAAAIATIGLKFGAYALTQSVGLLSDAIEALVNLAAALGALWALSAAARPPDERYPFGQAKAEYFSSGFEGALIIVAAAAIAYAAVERLMHPTSLTVGLAGPLLSGVASAINLGAAVWMLKGARLHRSITLEADAKHLLTDVWTSVGVLAGFVLVVITGIQSLDSLVALGVALHIVFTGWQLLQRSASGLLDQALGPGDEASIKQVLDRYRSEKVDFHALRTRRSGQRAFVSLHVLVPPTWTVRMAHELANTVERDIIDSLTFVSVITHIEPNDDPRAFTDDNEP